MLINQGGRLYDLEDYTIFTNLICKTAKNEKDYMYMLFLAADYQSKEKVIYKYLPVASVNNSDGHEPKPPISRAKNIHVHII
ncbi:hypothetical protein [Candidatus Endomicrobiellum agilis]|jgi:hypothetical protein|uniref:hypothetical protein n=1 Tax=Candidatus Endomicrobiellum agilis TaxID=3238957 RepID=UPI003589EC1F|nr:hypothetical protein [Endomicrobium sp.]